MKKKKILYIITKSNFGGAQRHLFDLIHALPQETYEVVVACGGEGGTRAREGALIKKLSALGVRVVFVRSFLRNVSPIFDLRAFFEIVSIIRTERPDILHVMSSKAGGLGTLAGRVCRVPRIIFTAHGLPFDETWRPLWQRRIIFFLSWITFALSHATIVLSRDAFVRVSTLPLLSRKVHLIRNGIGTLLLAPQDRAREAVLAHDPLLPPSLVNTLWVGTVAELHPNKNISLLIDSFARIATYPAYDALHLFLFGDGEERARLLEKVCTLNLMERVHFFGFVPDISSLLPALNIFLFPSRKEGLPYALLEAGHAGLPCIVSDIPGNTEIVEHGRSGLVVPPTPTAFAENLIALIDDPIRATTLGRMLRARIKERFSLTEMVEKTIAVYEKNR
jgi:glycosyltransferase involved in cell wall biosynthesis